MMMMENFRRSKELWTLVEGVHAVLGGAAGSEAQRKSAKGFEDQ